MKANTRSDVLCTVADLKASASAKLSKVNMEYFNHGAMDMITLRDNEDAYNRFKIRPRILSNVADIDTTTEIFGQKISLPFGFAPAAMHCIAHPEGEKATSRAAAVTGIPMALSTYSTVSLEDVIGQGAGNPYAFQLSILKDRDTVLRWVKRAEAAKYRALFITVDAPVLGGRLNERRNNFTLPEGLSFPNLEDGAGKPVTSHHHNLRDASNNWESMIPWIKENTKLEVWLKGIYTPEDVLLAIRYGLDGVIVSNHGGRQLDGVPATIDALPDCAAAAKGRIKIGIDGGIRRGTDIFKAIALGADICFLGRIPLWGLSHDGQAGVEWAVRTLEAELRVAMALAGCRTLSEISRSHLAVIGSSGILCRL